MKISFLKGNQKGAGMNNGMKVPYGAGRRVFPQLRWILVMLLATSPIHFFVLRAVYDALHVETRGVLLSETVTIHPFSDGVIDTVLVRPWMKVDSGAILLQYRPVGRWGVVQNVPVGVDLGAVRALYTEQASVDRSIALAQKELRLARDRLSGILWLQAREAATEAEVAGARLRVIQAEAQMEQLNLRKDLIVGRLAEDRRTVKLESAAFDTKVMRATCSGLVLIARAETGRTIRADEDIFVIEKSPTRYFVSAMLDPKDIGLAMPGRKAKVVLSNGRKLRAIVSDMGPFIDSTIIDPLEAVRRGDRQLQVTIDLMDSLPADARLSGLPVRVRYWRYWNW
jgi:multidrug resistance efflux pump